MARDASIGPVMPTGAGANVNESTPMEQRVPDRSPLSDGPKRGENDCFLPARYEVKKGDSTIIVEDR